MSDGSASGDEVLFGFLQSRGRDVSPEARGAWRRRIATWRAAALARCPGLNVSETDFARTLAVCIERSSDEVHCWDDLRGDELHLACGAAMGDPAALAHVGALLEDEMQRALRRFTASADLLEDVRQTVRERLFVGRMGPPAIGQYGGRGSLRGFLRVTATRTCLNALALARRDVQRHARDDGLLAALPSPLEDPEIAHLRLTYKAEFDQAFAEAIAALEPRQRTLLRQHYLDGLRPGEISALHGVHRTTVLRWIQQTQAELLRVTRRALQRRLGGGSEEIESIMRMLASQLDMSLQRYLV
ncbi:sigma-70 family RNA polymerase sigma factor [Sorangium sp. So ce542]|uniref:sigma-70 family RNA polymerase sigma factor n=1 Tax=Sorangium sp. So ce542 TaxID=3133316 RepID=UPI003F5E044A